MGRIVSAKESTAFTREGRGKEWSDAVYAYLKSHRGELFTAYTLHERLGKTSKLTRDSSLTTISLRWLYAGFNGGDDEWLHVERVRLPNRMFAYRWMPRTRKPERTESPAEALRRRRAEKFRKDAEVLLSQGATVNGDAPSREVLEEAARQLDAKVEATVEANGQATEAEPTKLEPDTEATPAEVAAFVAAIEPKEGFDLGDLVEVIGFTRQGHEPIVRDATGVLYRITEVM